MDANYDEVEDVKLACNDADVQGQGCADGALRPPQHCQICKKVGNKVSHAPRAFATVFPATLLNFF